MPGAIKACDERGVTVPIVSIAKREEELLVYKIGSQIDTAFIEYIQSQPRADITIHEDGDVYIVNLHPSLTSPLTNLKPFMPFPSQEVNITDRAKNYSDRKSVV